MTRRTGTYIGLLLLALAGLGACQAELSPELGQTGLFVRPTLFTGKSEAISGKTKAYDDTYEDAVSGDQIAFDMSLREDFMGTLDVFVAESGSTDFFKIYHLKAGEGNWVTSPYRYEGTSLLDRAEQLLHNNWAEANYSPSKRYNIWLTANNPNTTEVTTPGFTVADLQALQSSDDMIMRYYREGMNDPSDPEYWTNHMRLDAHNNKKQFLMDGHLEDWQLDANSPHQVFDVPLGHAACKVVLNVTFSDEKTMSLDAVDESGKHIMGTFPEYLAEQGMTVGDPRWKYVNFATRVSDVAGTTLSYEDAGLLTGGQNFNLFHDDKGTDDGKFDDTFSLVTYLFPYDWSEDPTKAPYILFSIGYPNAQGPNINYYRIPICDETRIKKLERNNIYIVNARLASLGSENASLELDPEQVRIEYHVIPWTDHHVQSETTTIKYVETKYLTVTPTEFTLTGDGTQSVELQWFASVSPEDLRVVDMDVSDVRVSYQNYLGETVNIQNNPSKTGTPGTSDVTITSTAPGSPTANGEMVRIKLTPSGLIFVESKALDSRAVKNIRFTVRLMDNTLPGGLEDRTLITQDITLKHFPLDNLQSIEGSWSSRWDGTFSSREYSFNPTAQGWSTWDGYEDNVECTLEQYNYASEGKSTVVLAGTPSDHDATDYRVNYTTGTNNTTVQTQYRNNVSQGVARYNTNGEANAALGGDGYWYWGDSRTTGAANNYDWRGETAGGSGTRYRWTNYYRSQFKKTHYYARRFYRESSNPSTGSWVDWELHTGSTYTDDHYTAKVVENGQMYQLTGANSRSTTAETNDNYHMTVIQITSTSDKYTLGVPVISNYISQDQVVSPAFVIASQLGAVYPFSGDTAGQDAATHCGTYMEVGADGTRYVGWRLPTAEEINIIIDYQDAPATSGKTISTVLGGSYYWALDGQSYYTGHDGNGTETNAYVRCVRDLTLEEVNKLNRN